MWVKSQDEETLMDFSGFILFEGISQIRLQCRIEVKNNLNTAITGKSNGGGLYCLGIYETKERALQVLTKIQKTIEDYMPANERQYDVVFEMPKE